MLETIVQRWKLRKLISEWCQFRDLVFQMMDGQSVGSEAQEEFLATKAKVASKLPVVLSLRTSPLQQEHQRHVESMTDLLNRYRTLSPESRPTAREREEFEGAWHQNFIFLNKLKGAPVPRETPAARHPRRVFVPTGIPSGRLHRRHIAFGLTGVLIRVGVFAIVIYLLGKAIGLHTEGGRLVSSPPTTAMGVGRNVLDGLQTIWGGVTHLVDPVVLAYGQTAAIALIGVLLLALGYLVFIRS